MRAELPETASTNSRAPALTKMYQLDREPWMQRAAEDTQLFQVVHIDGARLKYEARTARGVLYDAFDLEKRNGEPNRLTNRVPESDERRR